MSVMREISIVAVVLSGLTGCGGSQGGPNGPTVPLAESRINLPDPNAAPAPVFTTSATLQIEATNDSSATIDVVVTTPDQTLDLGQVVPGETIVTDLGELPSWVTLTATAVTFDDFGAWPTFPGQTLTFGNDYTDASPIAAIDWQPGSVQTVAPGSTAVRVVGVSLR